jgi:hypothetical protein
MKKWIWIILNLWATISMISFMAIMLVLTFDNPKTISFVPLLMYTGMIISGIICGKNVIDLLFEPDYKGTETTLTMAGLDLARDGTDITFVNGVNGYQPKEDVDVNNPPQGE